MRISSLGWLIWFEQFLQGAELNGDREVTQFRVEPICLRGDKIELLPVGHLQLEERTSVRDALVPHGLNSRNIDQKLATLRSDVDI